MEKIVKLDESSLRKIIMSEVRKAAMKKKINEAQVKTTDELADGDFGKMCGILKGKIESLYIWKDYCNTLEELQELIDRTFGDLME
jgi:hypothetical protein